MNPRLHFRHIRRRLALATFGIVATAATAGAHDFWLVPSAFWIAANGQMEVRGQTSSRFPTSEAAVAPHRVADARILEARGETRIADLSVSGKSLLIRHPPGSPGQKTLAVRLGPILVRESAEGFRRYMSLEGAPELAERYAREGRLPTDSVTRRYAKYAKTIVEVGSGGPRAFDRIAGHPLEFVPLTDPAGYRDGDSVAVRLIYRGSPLGGAHLHASGVPMGPEASFEEVASAAREMKVTTDANGVARLRVNGDGLWNVRTIHIVPADAGSGADWDVHWASLVFGVGRAGGSVTAGVGDSAAVAATVERYHQALSTGDTAAVLGLLAPDAVILESGGMETRAEYLSHHLPGDIAFAQAIPRERTSIRVRVDGSVAWATSSSATVGEYRGRAINAQGVELMVLSRVEHGWKIRAIHWSSRNRRP